MKVLHLTLKKKWFDMIASGEKKEEYREIKPFWIKRLTPANNAFDDCKEFYAVEFVNGGNFHDKHPKILVECLDIEIGTGKPEWGAEPDKEYFVIKLGNLLNTKQ